MKLILIFGGFLYTSGLFAQQLAAQNITAGLSLKYLFPEGDMGEYWKNAPGAGLLLGYNLNVQLSLEGEILFARFNPQKNIPEFPIINFIEFSGGVKYNLVLTNKLNINLKSGIENDMFIFRGEAAEVVYQENRNESEFGFFALAGLQYNIGKSIKFELNFKILGILSSPETINIFMPGFTIFIL